MLSALSSIWTRPWALTWNSLLKRFVPLVAIALLAVGCAKVPSLSSNPWQPVALPIKSTMLDLAFIDEQHGWLSGKNGKLLETTDGGKTWVDRSLDFGDLKYNLDSISFAGNEGWIAGQPSLLLHTTDAGQHWSEIPLSNKLPGDPRLVYALGPNRAEMTTNLGAIYQTTDGGKNWKALVQESVGVVRNIVRSPQGEYVSVSSRGNYYSTWSPGDAAWTQHNRTSSRRLQNMGFVPAGGLWAIARGGQVQFSDPADPNTINETIAPELKSGWGLLDLAYRTPEEVWVSGGGGSLLVSTDGGKTWQKDREVESIPSNFYKIMFLGPNRGFILGQEGTLLRYEPTT